MGDGKMDELKGKAKEAVGAVRNDDEQRREGQADQSKGKLKQAGEKVKDAVDDDADAIKR